MSIRCQFEKHGNLFCHVGLGRQSPPSFFFSLHAHARLQIHQRPPPYASTLLSNPSRHASPTLAAASPHSLRCHALRPIRSLVRVHAHFLAAAAPTNLTAAACSPSPAAVLLPCLCGLVLPKRRHAPMPSPTRLRASPPRSTAYPCALGGRAHRLLLNLTGALFLIFSSDCV